MVVVPAGRFTMGSPDAEPGRVKNEGPQHVVTIARSFAVSRFDVTRGEYARFVRATRHKSGDGCVVWTGKAGGEPVRGKSWRDPNFPQHDSHPVVCITWGDAKAYIEWLSRRTGKTYRFLSEAEWEYAARAGSVTRFHFGDDDDDLCKYANVWEWMQDCYHDSYVGAPDDGSAWVAGECNARVVRGGSLSAPPRADRSAIRSLGSAEARSGLGLAAVPDWHNWNLGLRLARNLD